MGKLSKKPDRLTHELVRDVEAPEAGAITYWDNDSKVPGFGVRIYAGGSKSFFLNYRFDGRERRYTIGPFPALVGHGGTRARQGTADANRQGA